MTTLTSTSATPTIKCGPIGCRPAAVRPAASQIALANEPTQASRLRRVVMAIRRRVPAASSSTPSGDVIATLSQNDRLGERH